jgi:hypothetical protein
MNEREAARLVDYGHTRVTAQTATGSVTGVAITVQMVPTVTVRLDDGRSVDFRLEDVELAEDGE